MIINIAKIPIYLITIESAFDRHNKVKSILDNYNLTYIPIHGKILNKNGLNFMEIQKKKSALVAEAHIEALQKTKPPFIVLEDDVNISKPLNLEVDIPDDTDAYYLGTSVWGMLNGQSVGGGTRGTKLNFNLSKVWGMLGIHSILYVTDNYVQKTIENLQKCILIDKFCDECIAEDMINHNVYCTNEPYFYQDDGHNNQVTLFPFRNYLP